MNIRFKFAIRNEVQMECVCTVIQEVWIRKGWRVEGGDMAGVGGGEGRRLEGWDGGSGCSGVFTLSFHFIHPPTKKMIFITQKKNIESRRKLKNGLRISFGCYFKTNFFVVVFCFYYKGYFSFENIFAKIQYFNCNFVKCSKNHLQRYPLNFNLRNIVTFFS